MVMREDGSWLIDGSVTIERLKYVLEILKYVLEIEDELPGEEGNAFNTLGGFVMYGLGCVPMVTDHFEVASCRFEVMDMDKNRVDKVLVARATILKQDMNENNS